MAKSCLEEEQNEFDRLLNSHDLRRALQIQAWIRRFTTHRDRKGPLTSEDLQELRDWWISRVQNLDSKKPQFTQTKNALNLIPNSEGILECRRRIQGMYPVYLPADSTFTRKLVQRIHAENLHGGVLLTMVAVRESYWIQKLRKLVKSVRSTCWGCKRFTAPPLTTPPPKLQGYLESHNIEWKFNLSRAPWWSGQFERLIGVVKKAMDKVIGRGSLFWNELIDVLLEVETQVNRRPLNYVEDNPDLPILTAATFLFQWTTHLPEEQTWRIPDKDLRRRTRFRQTCKDHMWIRWQREYLTALREHHNLFHKTANHKVKVGDAVIVRTDNKNRSKWPLVVVQQFFPGRDGYTCAVQLRTTKGVIERPVQHLYPLELQCETM